jgi:hypothetical protein
MEYQEVLPISREDAESLLKGENPLLICEVLLRLTYHDPDLFWVQDKCIVFLEYPDIRVKELAVTCLGHLARIHAQIGNPKVIPILSNLLKDSEIKGRVEDVLDDIEVFVQQA